MKLFKLLTLGLVAMLFMLAAAVPVKASPGEAGAKFTILKKSAKVTQASPVIYFADVNVSVTAKLPKRVSIWNHIYISKAAGADKIVKGYRADRANPPNPGGRIKDVPIRI